MMSKKQWLVALCILVGYLLLGAGIFLNIESQEETKKLNQDFLERKRVNDLLLKLEAVLPHGFEESFFANLTQYCGKPIQLDMENIQEERKWNFYNAVLFVITVVSTTGYGNLAPTTMFSRIFMIFYALIGIPAHAIVMITLAEYFAHSFKKLYRRWKTAKVDYDAARLGLISQIILYLVPGFTFFIFLPSVIMTIVEGWEYDVSVYYCFVTLTTIGFGDYVAGVENTNDIPYAFYIMYKMFLLIWIIGGFGYIIMILGFISRALQSKKMHRIEHMISQNIKKTPLKIRQELRSLLQEFLFLRVKPVYKEQFEYTPNNIDRSQSCPDLMLYRNMNSPSMMRKRALSECPRSFILHRIRSEAELEKIDKDRTFESNEAFIQQTDLLMKVVDALGNLEKEEYHPHAYEGFSDNEILASERYDLKWNQPSTGISGKRRRAVSEYRPPQVQTAEGYQPTLTWYGQEDIDVNNFKTRSRTFSEPAAPPIKIRHTGFLAKLKNKLIPAKDTYADDVEKQDAGLMREQAHASAFPEPANQRPKHRRGSLFPAVGRINNQRRSSVFTESEERYLSETRRGRPSVLSMNQEAVLEETSIADFIRALSAITVPETMVPPSPGAPRRKMGTAGLSPPRAASPRARRIAIRPNPQNRRTSLMPDATDSPREKRRFSLRPVDENLLAPPPYTPESIQHTTLPVPSNIRRFSRPIHMPSIFMSPVKRQVNKKDKNDFS